MAAQEKARSDPNFVRSTSSSSSITIPKKPDDIVDSNRSKRRRQGEENLPLVDQLMLVWVSVVAHSRILTSYLYRSTVVFMAEFVADILSHPRLRSILVDMIVAAINAFMNQDDIGSKIDETTRRVYDTDKALQASEAIGREVIPMVTGFVGGMASSLKPSEIRRRKKNKERRKSLNKQNEMIDRSCVSDVTNSQRLGSDGALSEEEEDDISDNAEDDDDRNSDWFSSAKKSK